ncbi:MAG: fibronectin type III-like domain-contianing protein, partial [Clostridiales bacterium]|nr:fibronectin type III-like domain-contianing protein [Clostridiales bacterium]
DMKLPANKIDILNRLDALGKPIVVLLSLGAPVETPWLEQANAVMALYTGGQAVAEATVRLLYGDACPSGKLAETWPVQLGDNPSALNYPQKETAVYEEGVFVGYRYYEKKNMAVRFPFGYGLSYTSFAYSNLRLDKNAMEDTETLTVSLDVTNTGSVAGKEIVQVYVQPVSPTVSRPVKELKGFSKVALLPGETKTVSISLNGRSFAYYNTEISDWYVESGAYRILAGASSVDIRAEATVQVTGTKQIRRKFTGESSMFALLSDPKSAPVIQMMMGSQHSIPDEDKAKALEDEDAPDAAMDNQAIGMDMPIGKMVNFSSGRLSFKKLDQLLAMLNADR